MKNSLNILICLFIFLAAGAAPAGDGTAPRHDDAIARILRETPTVASAKPSSRVPMVIGVHIGEYSGRTRFVVEMSEPVQIRTFTLGSPDRVVIDLPQVTWKMFTPPRPSAGETIRSYRFGQFRPGTSRIVLDLNRPVRLAEPMLLPPEGGYGYRVVLDLLPVAQTAFNRTAGWPADLKARERAAEAAPPPMPAPGPSRTKLVVVDPGHGGLDSGTANAAGDEEKDIVLAVGLRLQKALEARGYRVRMTRDSDVFVSLRRRVNMARAWHADLFVSIHVDSFHDQNMAGLSVYTLSEKGSDKAAAALAAKENQSDVIAGVDLSGENAAVAPILIDLAQRDTMNKSSRFAEAIVARMGKVTDVQEKKPHRSAAFAVLKAPDVPAALVELGYLSNAREAAEMKTSRWRGAVADAIAGAVDRYFADPAGVGRKSP